MILKMLSLNEKEIFEDYFMCEKSAREIQQAKGGTLEGIRAAIRRIRKKARLEEQYMATNKGAELLESLKTQGLSQQEMLNRLDAIVDAESARPEGKRDMSTICRAMWLR